MSDNSTTDQSANTTSAADAAVETTATATAATTTSTDTTTEQPAGDANGSGGGDETAGVSSERPQVTLPRQTKSADPSPSMANREVGGPARGSGRGEGDDSPSSDKTLNRTWETKIATMLEDDNQKRVSWNSKNEVAFKTPSSRSSRSSSVSLQFNPFDSSAPSTPKSRSRANSLRQRHSGKSVVDEDVKDAAYSNLEKRKSQELSNAPVELGHSWVFWFDERSGKKGMKKRDFESVMREVGVFGTVQEFWEFWNNMVDVYQLPKYCNLRMFKEGVKPLWEDPANANGGKWVIPCKDKDVLKALWAEVVLAVIGEQGGVSDDVCGVVLAVRPRGEDSVSIWNSDRENPDPIGQLISDIFDLLQIPKEDKDGNVRYHYQVNSHAIKYNKNFKPIPKKSKRDDRQSWPPENMENMPNKRASDGGAPITANSSNKRSSGGGRRSNRNSRGGRKSWERKRDSDFLEVPDSPSGAAAGAGPAAPASTSSDGPDEDGWQSVTNKRRSKRFTGDNNNFDSNSNNNNNNYKRRSGGRRGRSVPNSGRTSPAN